MAVNQITSYYDRHHIGLFAWWVNFSVVVLISFWLLLTLISYLALGRTTHSLTYNWGVPVGYLIGEGLRWVVDYYRLGKISSQNVEVFYIISLDTHTVLTKQTVSKNRLCSQLRKIRKTHPFGIFCAPTPSKCKICTSQYFCPQLFGGRGGDSSLTWPAAFWDQGCWATCRRTLSWMPWRE